MEHSRVSIIVTAYNLEKYIGRCAESLLSQTMKDLEIIFVDDCSTDRTLEVLEEVLDRHPDGSYRVKTMPLAKNQGVCNARHSGFKESIGEYVMFLDGDDWYDESTVERMYQKASVDGADMVTCRIMHHYEDGSSSLCTQFDDTVDRDRYVRNMISMSSDKATVMLGNKMFRRTLIEGIELWAVGITGEDWVISVQAALASKKPASVDDVFLNYTVRADSLSHHSSKEISSIRVDGDRRNIEGVMSVLESKGVLQNYRHEIVARKYISKKIFESFGHDKNLDKQWLGHFSEINHSILFNPCLSLYSKKVFVLKVLHLYGIYYGIRGHLKIRNS